LKEGTMTAILKFNPGDHDAQIDALVRELANAPEQREKLLRALLGEPACRQVGLYPIPEGFKVSVVIPVYNERQWVRELVRSVQAVNSPTEIILVDDCSTDGPRDILKEMEQEGLKVVFQEV